VAKNREAPYRQNKNSKFVSESMVDRP